MRASRSGFCVLCSIFLGLVLQAVGQTPNVHLDTIALPPGFSIDLYTSLPVPNARTLVLSDNTTGGNIVYVSTNGLSNVSK